MYCVLFYVCKNRNVFFSTNTLTIGGEEEMRCRCHMHGGGGQKERRRRRKEDNNHDDEDTHKR